MVGLKFPQVCGTLVRELQIRKPHSNYKLAGVLSIPKFAQPVPQGVANFGIGTPDLD
jgi:hypothetical protein